MIGLGIKTGRDLKKFSKNELIQFFGKAGNYFYDIAHGLDKRPVVPDRIRKSIGKEKTLGEDTVDVDLMIKILDEISVRIEGLLAKDNRKGFTITLKIKYFDFQSITRSVTLSEPITRAGVIMGSIKKLLKNTEAGTKKVRLLGITVSNFMDEKQHEHMKQLPLPLKYSGQTF